MKDVEAETRAVLLHVTVALGMAIGAMIGWSAAAICWIASHHSDYAWADEEPAPEHCTGGR